MPVTATLRVVYPHQVNAERRKTLIHEAASRLQALGFQVLTEGRMSVIVRADAGKYRKVLGVPELRPNASFAGPIHPLDETLVGIVDRVEVAGLTQYAD